MNTYTHSVSRAFKTVAVFYCLAMVSFPATSDDIDIFIGSSGGSAAAPNVMFLMDDSTDWSSNSSNYCLSSTSACPTLPTSPAGQKYNTSPKVGGNELNAMIATLASLYTNPTGVPNINIGLASFTASGNSQNGYIRFGARNISTPSSGAIAYSSLNSILSTMDPTASATKVNVGKKEESESLFELYQYFNSGAPGSLPVAFLGSLADYPGNSANSLALPQTDSTGANYTAYTTSTSSSCPVLSNGFCYRGPSTACSKNFIIYIVNHGHTNNGIVGSPSYNSVPSTNLADIQAWTVGGVTGDPGWIGEWANFMYQSGISIYIIDIGGDASPSNSYSIALQQAAKLGGGKYYSVTDASTNTGFNSLVANLNAIFIEIQAVNSTFASVSLPVNATNRSQNLNQVFIPMFRPDQTANPLWRGNLKRYQLISVGGAIELGDVNSTQAINPGTGFVTSCAQSYWTSDSSTYWQNVSSNPSPQGTCTGGSTSVWSDSPDGAFVEKGGVAEVIRKGNNPSGATTWNLNRTVYTQPLAGGALAAFSSSSPGLGTASGLSTSTTPTLSNLASFILGKDVNSEYSGTLPPPGATAVPATLTRPSLHGDTIHSQPLPVTYSTGVYAFYGSNDGMLRAVNAATGQEQWAFVAPEFYSRLSRLETQLPLVKYPNVPSGIIPTPTAKDYFFDGSIGLYQNAANTQVWIYPTMRRGGRTIYGLDVTDPTSPSFKWKVGCPNLTDNTGCAATSSSSWTGSSITSMGQTWSVPNVAASVLGYSGPVIVVGGGYDKCEDADTATPSCTGSTGASVYVIDANTGALVATFPTGQGRSVAADVALISVPNNGVIDHGYAVDTGGNIFRIDFNASGPSSWVMNRVAYTNGSGRKFLYAPSLLHNPGNYVYLALGSGDREHPLITQYPYTTPVVNRFYVYRDDLTSTSTSTPTNLDGGTGSTTINVSPTASCTASNILPPPATAPSTPTSNSWYLNLNQYGTGEQTVTSALIVAGMVTFSTNRPIPATSGSCSTTLGEARGYFLNLLNGSGAIGVAGNCGGSLSSTFVGGGMPPSPVFASVPINGQTVPVVIGAVQRQNGANSTIAPQQVNPTISSKRKTIYWKNTGVD